MKTAIYKRGGRERVWNTTAHIKIIDSSEIEKYVSDGWCTNPADLCAPEPVADTDEFPEEAEEAEGAEEDLIGEQPKKRGRKPKADLDESDD